MFDVCCSANEEAGLLIELFRELLFVRLSLMMAGFRLPELVALFLVPVVTLLALTIVSRIS